VSKVLWEYIVTKRWLSGRKSDYYYRKARKEHYRSRAAYKLKQINETFDVIHTGDRVVDIGASPGGWSQVASEIVGSAGSVIGVDIKRMRPIDGVEFVLGDICDKKTVETLLGKLGGAADVIISDMSPNISGHYPMDHARSVELCEHALKFSRMALRAGGSMIVKIFEGDLYQEYLAKTRRHFGYVKGHGPRASRQASSEIYVIAKGFISQLPSEIV